MVKHKKLGKSRAVFESDQPLSLPEDEEGKYFLVHEGKKYYAYCGHEGTKSIMATFTIPFKTFLLVYEFKYEVTLEFQKNYVFVWFYYADLYQIYRWLKTTFKVRFRLKSLNLVYDLLTMETPWPCNEEWLLLEFKHDPANTLSFVEKHLGELITLMRVGKVPKRFNEEFKFIRR